jgi:hypothetical protein
LAGWILNPSGQCLSPPAARSAIGDLKKISEITFPRFALISRMQQIVL